MLKYLFSINKFSRQYRPGRKTFPAVCGVNDFDVINSRAVFDLVRSRCRVNPFTDDFQVFCIITYMINPLFL